MRLRILFLLIMSSGWASESALAEKLAVNQWNVDVAPSLQDIEDVGSGYDVDANISFPLAAMLGMELSLGGGGLNRDDDYDSYSGKAGIKIFLGHHETGRLGLGITTDSTEYYQDDSDYDDSDFTINSNDESFFGELFLGDFTLAATFTHSESESDEVIIVGAESDIALYEVSYYPTDGIRLGIGFSSKDSDAKIAQARFQVGKAVSIDAKYIDADLGIKAYAIGVTIYFRGGDSLKENDRWY